MTEDGQNAKPTPAPAAWCDGAAANYAAFTLCLIAEMKGLSLDELKFVVIAMWKNATGVAPDELQEVARKFVDCSRPYVDMEVALTMIDGWAKRPQAGR